MPTTPTDTAYRWAQGTHVWTSGIVDLPGETADITGHYGPFNNNQDTDNRPPYRVVIIIERWK